MDLHGALSSGTAACVLHFNFSFHPSIRPSELMLLLKVIRQKAGCILDRLPFYYKRPFTNTLTSRDNGVPLINLECMFLDWKEKGVLGENSHMHGKKKNYS